MLRHAWPYRFRLAFSVFAALLAALLWGTNFTSIYPVLKLLHTGKSLHSWIDDSIAATQKQTVGLSDEVDRLANEDKELDKLPPSRFRDKKKRELANDLLKAESKLRAARSTLYWSQVLRKYVYLWLPATPSPPWPAGGGRAGAGSC